MPVSDRKKRHIRQKKKEAIEVMEETIDALRKKQQSGRNLNTKELDTLKWAINNMEEMEHEIIEKTEDILPEGKLKEYIENLHRLQVIVYGEGTKNKLTKEIWEKIIDEMGYYRCSKCGECHGKERLCVFEEYAKFKEKDINIGDKEYNVEDE